MTKVKKTLRSFKPKFARGFDAPPYFEYGAILDYKYKIQDLLGQGAFGQVFKVKNLETKQVVAVKVEPRDHQNKLGNEAKLLTLLKHVKGVPDLLDSGIVADFSYMVMPVLGVNIYDLQKCMENQRFDVAFCCDIFLQLLDSLEAMHTAGYLHLDIKPNNFCLGYTPSVRNKVFLIDFGLATCYVEADGTRKKKREFVAFRGTSRYSSMRIHKNCDPAPCDDLVALLFSTVDMMEGDLPWLGDEPERKIVSLKGKEFFGFEKFTKVMPMPFFEIGLYLEGMNFIHDIDYNMIRNLIGEALKWQSDPENLKPKVRQAQVEEFVAKHTRDRFKIIKRVPDASNLAPFGSLNTMGAPLLPSLSLPPLPPPPAKHILKPLTATTLETQANEAKIRLCEAWPEIQELPNSEEEYDVPIVKPKYGRNDIERRRMEYARVQQVNKMWEKLGGKVDFKDDYGADRQQTPRKKVVFLEEVTERIFDRDLCLSPGMENEMFGHEDDWSGIIGDLGQGNGSVGGAGYRNGGYCSRNDGYKYRSQDYGRKNDVYGQVNDDEEEEETSAEGEGMWGLKSQPYTSKHYAQDQKSKTDDDKDRNVGGFGPKNDYFGHNNRETDQRRDEKGQKHDGNGLKDAKIKEEEDDNDEKEVELDQFDSFDEEDYIIFEKYGVFGEADDGFGKENHVSEVKNEVFGKGKYNAGKDDYPNQNPVRHDKNYVNHDRRDANRGRRAGYGNNWSRSYGNQPQKEFEWSQDKFMEWPKESFYTIRYKSEVKKSGIYQEDEDSDEGGVNNTKNGDNGIDGEGDRRRMGIKNDVFGQQGLKNDMFDQQGIKNDVFDQKVVMNEARINNRGQGNMTRYDALKQKLFKNTTPNPNPPTFYNYNARKQWDSYTMARRDFNNNKVVQKDSSNQQMGRDEGTKKDLQWRQ
ncbi:unnamed protein product [Bursaphelenchus okinawaensis]|uniref:non-specific serine/threonine protein kinase n=1 Tax=Bursaphelenchus okinawaensis TaxID=465554 RepID=A0A811KCK3_9BILA|nr:unnamed protein product [Bursaphelenchus okinawaensis]CAG9100978.1 unnamed protein product [Bursaphelenchus okinawaensis]